MADSQVPLEQAFAGQYALERELGRGGMGLVYLARSLEDGRLLALKVLRPELATMVARQRFEQEIRVAASLRHPNIVPIEGSGVASGRLYCVMPYVDGQSLRERLEERGRLPLTDVIAIGCGLASALDWAHSRNIVHRDIKPENILCECDRALLCDFGVARAITIGGGERLSSSGFIVGTPEYMSPEQADGRSTVDGRTDVYSLAAVLYEMLAGYAPFSGPSMQAVLARKRDGRIPVLRPVRPDISERCEKAVLRALARAPEERPQTAGDLMREFGS